MPITMLAKNVGRLSPSLNRCALLLFCILIACLPDYKVLNTMTTIIGPILPHLAEEINSYRYGSRSSVFVNQWTRLVRHTSGTVLRERSRYYIGLGMDGYTG